MADGTPGMPDSRPRITSPNQLHRKLNQPRIARVADFPEQGTLHAHIRYSELRMIPGIKELSAEFKPGSLGDRGVLHHTDVPVVQARRLDDVPPAGPESSKRR